MRNSADQSESAKHRPCDVRVTGAQQRFDGGDLRAAPRHLTLEIRRRGCYFAVAGGGFGGHLWPVFARHPIW